VPENTCLVVQMLSPVSAPSRPLPQYPGRSRIFRKPRFEKKRNPSLLAVAVLAQSSSGKFLFDFVRGSWPLNNWIFVSCDKA